METYPNQPMSPTPIYNLNTGEVNDQFMGLTKLEYFAAIAMQGLLSGMTRQSVFVSPNSETSDFIIWEALAKESVLCAKALVAELNK
jgi:hypothetical protein